MLRTEGAALVQMAQPLLKPVREFSLPILLQGAVMIPGTKDGCIRVDLLLMF